MLTTTFYFASSQLSTDLDALLFLVYDALDRSRKCKSCRRKLVVEDDGNSSFAGGGGGTGKILRAVLPILHVHSKTSEMALAHATSRSFGIDRILHELEGCANDLMKYAEQNHALADQLDGYSCTMTPGKNNILSNEKRAIAEIEDAVVERIEELICLAAGSSRETHRFDETYALAKYGGNSHASMSDLCDALFLKQQTETSFSTVMPPRSVDNNVFTESQMFAAEALQIMHSNSR